MARWDVDQVPDLDGRRVLVTGGNGGIGREAARLLAGRGAQVVIACRNLAKGQEAADGIRAATGAGVELLELDLADLASVAAAAETYCERHERLDVLVNNAGVMALPYRATPDGFEMHFGTNHLGHFALTGRLLARLLAAERPRVVTVSSNYAKIARIDLDNLDASRGYNKHRAYGQSKLANLLFMFELQRRADAAGCPLVSASAHPGYASTGLFSAGTSASGNKIAAAVYGLGGFLFAQSAEAGAWPTVYAAAMPDVTGGDFIGPDGIGEMRGAPTKVPAPSAARDPQVAARLWLISEQLTGVRYEALAVD